MSPASSLRRFGAAALLGASVSSVSRRGVDATNASVSTSRAQSPTSAGPRAFQQRQAPGQQSPTQPQSPSATLLMTPVTGTAKTVVLLDDTLAMDYFEGEDVASVASPVHNGGGRGGVSPTSPTKGHPVNAVQAKLDRSREAHVKAEEKRHAIHNAAKDATRGVRVMGVQDLEYVDKRNYFHPLSDQRADLAMRVQTHKQRGFTTYLSRVPFTTGAVR